MNNLLINQLSIRTSTNIGMYGVDIPFLPGLNIIHAENTHGKSTCIQSIIYALGLEGCLGPSRKVPLKTALTAHLRAVDGSKALISESKIYLQISNGHEVVTILRSSKPEKSRLISVFFGATVLQAINEEVDSCDYFLHMEGSATRERGFHCFLAEFLGISLPDVAKYNGGESPLYLEAIFAMNYVEQTRGWGGILNILPNYLGIKDLSQRIIEHTLNLDVQEIAKKRQHLNQVKKDAERIWELNVDNLISIAKKTSGFVSDNLDDKINKKTSISEISYLYQYLDSEKNSYPDYVQLLKTELEVLKVSNTNSKLDDQKILKLNNELEQQTTFLSEQEQAINLLIADLNLSKKYLSSIELRIHDVKDSLRKYKDLVRLETIGSQEEFKFDRSKCPTCHSDIEDSLLSHVQCDESKILGLDDNIKYLEKQKEAFDFILKGEVKSTERKEARLSSAKNILNQTRRIIREIKESLTDESALPSRSDLMKELNIERNIEELESSLRDEENIKEKLKESLNTWQFANSSLNAIPHNGFSANDWRKLKAFKEDFLVNLADFGYSSNDLSEFEISHQSYKPTLNDVDINSEASASDNIRVIWAYLYSMLTFDQKFIGSNNHLGLLIMDEPRQQEAKNESFAEFISKAASVKSIDKQIIIGTSENYADLGEIIAELDVNLCHYEKDIIGML